MSEEAEKSTEEDLVPEPNEVYVLGEIGDPEDYEEDFRLIRSLGEGDELTIIINSVGGNLSTTLMFMNLIRESKADIITKCCGEASSGGLYILLTGDTIEVDPMARLLMHTCSYEGWGTPLDHARVSTFKTNHMKVVLENLCEGLYSAEEISRILKGEDLYESGFQFIERLEKLSK